jgi:DNA polymerase III psi subunit
VIESQRRAYLDAMGLDVWSIKPPEQEFDRLLFQPGEGSTLLICDALEATATRIAGDIVRALAGKVVWAWPDPEGSTQSPTLEQAVSQYLFTRVVLFGDGLARQMFRGDAPLVTGSASITVSDSLDELAVLGNAKQALWNKLSVNSSN